MTQIQLKLDLNYFMTSLAIPNGNEKKYRREE